jgi:voltage-gated potassium channel
METIQTRYRDWIGGTEPVRLPKIIRFTWKGLVLLIILAFISGILFYFLDDERTLGESFYLALITLTTVGYGDVAPGSGAAKVISVFLACSGILLYGYIGALVMFVVMESSLSGVFGMNKCRYKNHFVICGWTSLSEIVLLELLTEDREVAVISEEQDDIAIIKRIEEKGKVFPIYGDPSKGDVLAQAQINEARVVILCMGDDSKNLITALHIKELNPGARIIVRTTRAELKKTMKIAGVTYVVTPDVMAGRLIASAAFEPEVANFVEDVTSATDVGGADLQQFTIKEGYANTVLGLSKSLRAKTGTTLVGIAKKVVKEGFRGERYEVTPNPGDDVKVKSGDIVILLGNEEQFKKVNDYLKTNQGR